MSENVTQNGSSKDRDQWKRKWWDRGWDPDFALRVVSLVLVLGAVALFVSCGRGTNQLGCGQTEVLANMALIAWKDFVVGAVVVAFIWFVRSLWE